MQRVSTVNNMNIEQMIFIPKYNLDFFFKKHRGPSIFWKIHKTGSFHSLEKSNG